MKEKIPTTIAIVIILLFFLGAIAIFIYQYIMLDMETERFNMIEVFSQKRSLY